MEICVFPSKATCILSQSSTVQPGPVPLPFSERCTAEAVRSCRGTVSDDGTKHFSHPIVVCLEALPIRDLQYVCTWQTQKLSKALTPAKMTWNSSRQTLYRAWPVPRTRHHLTTPINAE